MAPTIRPLAPSDHAAVIELSLRAWAPGFASVEHVLQGSGVFERLHPDWRVTQRDAVTATCTSDTLSTWVVEANADHVVAGFVAVHLDHDHDLGEISSPVSLPTPGPAAHRPPALRRPGRSRAGPGKMFVRPWMGSAARLSSAGTTSPPPR